MLALRVAAEQSVYSDDGRSHRRELIWIFMMLELWLQQHGV